MALSQALLQALAKPSDPVGDAIRDIPNNLLKAQQLKLAKIQTQTAKSALEKSAKIQNIMSSSTDMDTIIGRLEEAGFQEEALAFEKSTQQNREQTLKISEQLLDIEKKEGELGRAKMVEGIEDSGREIFSILATSTDSTLAQNLVPALEKATDRGIIGEEEGQALLSLPPQEMRKAAERIPFMATKVKEVEAILMARKNLNIRKNEINKMSSDDLFVDIAKRIFNNRKQGLPPFSGLVPEEKFIWDDKIGKNGRTILEALGNNLPASLETALREGGEKLFVEKFTELTKAFTEIQTKTNILATQKEVKSMSDLSSMGLTLPPGMTISQYKKQEQAIKKLRPNATTQEVVRLLHEKWNEIKGNR